MNNILAAPLPTPRLTGAFLTDNNPGLFSRVNNNVILRTAVYYVALFGISALLWQLPQAQAVIRGSMDALFSGPGFPGLGTPSSLSGVGTVPVTLQTLVVTVAAAMTGAVALALPVAWIYALTRHKRGYQQSVVQTLMVLPPLVASVVVLVKYSLALAFGLGAIVAAVRFRNTLEDSKDAVYIFLATAIGLAAAVQLPVAAVISIGFNLIVLALWKTDFGKMAAYEGERAKRRLEKAAAAMKQTGSFVAMVDNELFENMTPQQLELVADRAWRRRRKLETETPDDEEMQRRDVLLRVKTTDPEGARVEVETVLEEFLKKWRVGGVVHEKDGTHTVEYAVQLKKTARSADLLDALNSKSQVIGVEIK
jgi:hypothetical protein